MRLEMCVHTIATLFIKQNHTKICTNNILSLLRENKFQVFMALETLRKYGVVLSHDRETVCLEKNFKKNIMINRYDIFLNRKDFWFFKKNHFFEEKSLYIPDPDQIDEEFFLENFLEK